MKKRECDYCKKELSEEDIFEYKVGIESSTDNKAEYILYLCHDCTEKGVSYDLQFLRHNTPWLWWKTNE